LGNEERKDKIKQEKKSTQQEQQQQTYIYLHTDKQQDIEREKKITIKKFNF
jgi:hypothetical protein